MPPKKAPRVQEETPTDQLARTLLYEWWYSIAEVLFERVCEVTELDAEQKEALRAVSLRPNDFHIHVDTIDPTDSS